MTAVIERSGRFYLRQPNGRRQFYVCWTEDGSPRRVTTRTSDPAEARRRFAEFVVKRENGERVVAAVSEDWPAIVAEIVDRQRAHARKRGLPFEIDADYVLRLMAASRFRCPVSGVPFTWSRDQILSRGPWSPSVDRIDNHHGYIRGNIRVVCLAANIAMNAWGYDVLLRLANGVVASHLNPAEVVGAAGIEPATPTMSTWCSTAELSARTCQSLTSAAAVALPNQALRTAGNYHVKDEAQPIILPLTAANDD
jgi:hypothetical protein